MKDRIVKTIVPFVVGWVVSVLTVAGLNVPPEFTADLSNLLTLLVGAGYYVLVVFLTKLSPVFEILLGSPKKPEYKE